MNEKPDLFKILKSIEHQDNPDNLDQLDLYKTHPLVERLHLTEEEFTKNFIAIKRTVDEQLACDDLPNKCINANSIHTILVRNENGRLVYKAIECPKMKMINKNLEYVKNYLYYSFAPEYLKLSLSKKYFDDDNHPSKIQLIQRFLQTIKELRKNKNAKLEHGLYIFGPYGIGKTYTTIAFANDLAREGKKIVFCFLPLLVMDIKEGINNEQVKAKTSKIIQNMKKADVLFLDDIGAEKGSNWIYSEHLFIVLNYRMEHKLPTFFTSNLSIEQLKTKLVTNCGQIPGNRLLQRILATTNNKTFKLEGINKRYPSK